MPELAELRLTSDYINEASDQVQYTNIEKKLINIRNAGDGFTIRQCVPTGWRPTPINGTIQK